MNVKKRIRECGTSLAAAGTGLLFLGIAAYGDFSYNLNSLTYNYGAIGSINRSIFDKAKETVSVKDFGAVGDGIADDTAAIQNAITYTASRLWAGIVLLPPGTYKITSTIQLNIPGVTLMGQGGGAPTDYAASIYNASNGDAIRVSAAYAGVRNVRIYQSSPTAGYAVVLDNITEAFADLLKIENVYNGIKTNGCTSVHISDIMFKNPVGDYAVDLVGGTAGADAIYVKRVRGTTTDTGLTWIRLTGDMASVYITDGYFENGLRGALLEQGTAVNNTNPKFLYTQNLTFVGMKREGVKMTAGSTQQWTNTAVYDCGVDGYSGWYIAGYYAHLMLHNCAVIGSKQHGILIESGRIITITNCMVGNNSAAAANMYDGIRIGGTNVDEISIVGGNCGRLFNAANNQANGIHLYGTAHDKVVITGVDVSGNTTAITDATASSKVKFIRNNIGALNPDDGTIGFSEPGSIANGTVFCEYVYGRKLKLTGIVGKLDSGACTLQLSVDGTTYGNSLGVSSNLAYTRFSEPVEIDATTAGRRIELAITGNSSGNTLEGGFSYTNYGAGVEFKSSDFDNNGRVDLSDLHILAQYWLTNEPSVDIAPAGSPDGQINLLDFAELAQDWLR